MKKYYDSGLVDYAYPNYAISVASTPNDEYFSNQYYLNNNQYANDIDAPEAWSIEQGHYDVLVAVIDTGIDIGHTDLLYNINAGLSDDYNGNYHNEVGQWREHGTKVAGIISADMNNSTGIASVAGGWDNYTGVKLMCLACGANEGQVNVAATVNAIDEAIDSGADIINCSWGGNDIEPSLEEDLATMIASCYDNHIIVVAATGNNNGPVNYPAAYDHVIGVGSCSPSSKEDYSNFGEGLDVVAAGGNSVVPIYSTDDYGTYGSDYGTSFATPQVSGLAALLLSYDPSLTVDEITQIICETTVKYSNHTFDDWYSGWGPSVPPYGTWDDSLGYGRINAYEALLRVKGEGTLETDVTWENDFEIKGNLEIPAGTTMTIGEDVTVSVCEEADITVNGTLTLCEDAEIVKIYGEDNWGDLTIAVGGTLNCPSLDSNIISDYTCINVLGAANVDSYLTIASGQTLNVFGTLNMGGDMDIEIYGDLNLNGTISKISGGWNWGWLEVCSGGSISFDSGATLDECDGLRLSEEATLNTTLYLGEDVELEIEDSFTLGSSGLLTKISGDGDWGDMTVESGATLYLTAGSEIQYANRIDIYGSMSCPNNPCYINNIGTGVYIHQNAQSIHDIEFSDNYYFGFRLLAPYCVTVSDCIIGGSSEWAVSVDDYGILDLNYSILENTGGDNIVIDSNYARLDLDWGTNAFYPYYGNAIDNRPTYVTSAEYNFWGSYPPPPKAYLFMYPSYVNNNVPWTGPAKIAAEGEEMLAHELEEIINDNGDLQDGTKQRLYCIIDESNEELTKQKALSILLRDANDKKRDCSEIRSSIERELNSADNRFAASLNYLLCDTYRIEGNYEKACELFESMASRYHGTSMEVSMLVKLAIMYAHYYHDDKKALEYANAAAAINPGQESLRSAFTALGMEYEPDEYEDIYADEDYLDSLIPDGPDENEPTIAENCISVVPNPFNPDTTFNFAISDAGTVELVVYSVTGQKVATLVDDWMDAGTHSVRFEGRGLASGMYIYRFSSPGFSDTGRMLLVK